jgi:hypothetical protein
MLSFFAYLYPSKGHMNVYTLGLFLMLTRVGFSQLDPFYFGTYINSNETIKFTVYTMDEVVDDCFIVEKELLKEGLSIQHWNGYGHCNGEDGRMEFFLENSASKIPVEFNLLNDGLRSLTIFPLGANSEVYLEKNE